MTPLSGMWWPVFCAQILATFVISATNSGSFNCDAPHPANFISMHHLLLYVIAMGRNDNNRRVRRPEDLFETHSDVIVYHDGTEIRTPRGHLYGQVLLFVPENVTLSAEDTLVGDFEAKVPSLRCLYEEIVEMRTRCGVDHRLHFKDIRKSGMWSKRDEIGRQAVGLGVDALRVRRSRLFPVPLRCKVAAVFYPLTTFVRNFSGDHKERVLRCHETFIRTGLKSAVHSLYDERNSVTIKGIISDGDPYHRSLSRDRVLWRLALDELYGRTPLMDHVDISPNATIVHQSSDHTVFAEGSDKAIHATMLQMADMFLGSIGHVCYREAGSVTKSPRIGTYVEDKRWCVAYPVKVMIDKRRRGRGFRYSSHWRSFSVSEMRPSKKTWSFIHPSTKLVTEVRHQGQLRLDGSLGDLGETDLRVGKDSGVYTVS